MNVVIVGCVLIAALKPLEFYTDSIIVEHWLCNIDGAVKENNKGSS